jgi:hypothetical protein
MANPFVTRRTLLRGAAGAAVALPLLEAMQIGRPRRLALAAAAIPKRYVVLYGGLSTRKDTGKDDPTVPLQVGAGYTAPLALQPLVDLGLKDQVTVVSGLRIPSSGDDSNVEPGGKGTGFHFATMAPQCSGTKSGKTAPLTTRPTAPSSDVLVHKAIGGDTEHLVYRVQVADYVNGSTSTSGGASRFTFREVSPGKVEGVDPVFNPYSAYKSLFSDLKVVSSDPAAAAQADYMFRQRKSVLDLVRQSTESLLLRLGPSDRRVLDQHFTEIRALEGRLRPFSPSGTCAPAKDPGDRFRAIGGGWSGETERGEILADLVGTAFACNRARVASFMITFWKSYLARFHINGMEGGDVHSCTHGKATYEQHAKAVAWHVRYLGLIVKKLRDAKEVDGSSVLDHSALVMMWEGGHSGKIGSEGSHSTANMTYLVAGGAGRLKRGHHIIAKDVHPAKVTIAAMKAVRGPTKLGDIEGPLTALFG